MKLSSGDKVCIIAPASQLRGVDRGLLDEAVSLLKSWQLNVDVRIDEQHHFYLAGSDVSRVRHLNFALEDPATKAIFCMRGGYGSSRLLRYLDRELTPTPKFLVGHSDITTLHLAVTALWPQVVGVHGPNVATRQLLGAEASCRLNRQSLHDTLFSNQHELAEPLEFLLPGRAEGAIQGGCLSLVTSNIGSAFQPHVRDGILFLEDTGEPPYRIDRMLTQLRNAGYFDHVCGVIFGEMNKCVDPYNDIKSVLADLFHGASFPVAFGLKSGHGEVNLSFRLGAQVALDSDVGMVRIVNAKCSQT